jgi:hypothetical protein
MIRMAVALVSAILVIACGVAADADDSNICKNYEATLKTDATLAVSACRRLADRGDYAEAAKWHQRAAD